jgi:hypothetical protein
MKISHRLQPFYYFQLFFPHVKRHFEPFTVVQIAPSNVPRQPYTHVAAGEELFTQVIIYQCLCKLMHHVLLPYKPLHLVPSDAKYMAQDGVEVRL